MSVTIKYKGNTIASANTDTTKTLQTSGKYCEADIVVENVQDGGITPTGSITLTEENTYDVTEKATAVVDFSSTRADLAEAVTAKGVDTLPTSSFDTIATNIGLISGGGGLPTSITKIDGGSFTFASSRAISAQISHNLGEIPKGVIVWTNEPVTSATVLYYGVLIKDTQYGVAEGYRFLAACNTPTSAWSSAGAITDISSSLTDTTFSLNHNSRDYGKNIEYKWIAWA